MHLCWYKFLKFDSRWSGNYADLLGLKVETWDSNESKFNNVIPAGEQSEVLGGLKNEGKMEGIYDRQPRMEEAIPNDSGERKSYVKKRLPVDLLSCDNYDGAIKLKISEDLGKCLVAGDPLILNNLMLVKTNKEWDHAITFCIRTTITYSKARAKPCSLPIQL
ncbi:hypothetical protein C5167_009022 [Papaver somniferum]|uniref:Uncharacterized protein n=1 Tax=Papaver somniferum TaxID=3469 RepID=A0A4Y7K063_PAPSO|nr:hypothetical protein C5167_009022 [Papaver somniferum]